MRYSHSVYIWFDGRGFFTNSRYVQYFMRQLLTLAILFFSLTLQGQVQKNKFLTSGTFRVRNFYDGGDTYKTFQIGMTNKTGYFITNSIVVGIKSDYTWTHKKTKQFGALQQGGSQWYEKGIYNRHEYAIGAFADKYYKLGKKLYLTVGLYGQYYRFTDIEVGDYFDQNDTYIGVSYRKQSFPNKVAQLGLTNSLVYFLNERFGINCLVSSLDFTINNKNNRGVEFDLRAPIMNLGIQYHFPK